MALLLLLIIFLPALAGVGCLAVSGEIAKKLALASSVIVMLLSFVLAASFDYDYDYEKKIDVVQADGSTKQVQVDAAQFVTDVSWIETLNVNFTVGVDGLSLALVILTTVLSVLIVLASWNIEKATSAFMALYLFLMSGMFGVFLSLDMFLFYVFFEISLLPMYFLIGIWGGPRKEYAAIKFFLYTLAGSICLLIVMLGFYFMTGKVNGGENTWYMVEIGDKVSLQSDTVRAMFGKNGTQWGFGQVAFWLTLIAFAIKIPAAPLHTWLPDAHVEAPTPISMILAGVLLKMGGYALMRITYPFFPDAAQVFWVAVASLGVFGIIYGALCAMAQTDWKKLVAYSSVSHMGFVTLGIAVLNDTGWYGAYFEMIGHGIASAMMFFMVGVVYERAHHREINRFGGLWLKFPGYGGWSLICFFAGMGLPGLCGFIGEIMVLLGTFDAANTPAIIEASGGVEQATTYAYWLGALAASGVILTAGYILWMFQRVYMGKPRPDYEEYAPVNNREYAIMTVLGIAAIVFGVVPTLVFMTNKATFDKSILPIVQAVTDVAKDVASAAGL